MDHYFLGQAHLKKGITDEHQHKARSHFDRALDFDPDNSIGALVMRAWVGQPLPYICIPKTAWSGFAHSEDRPEQGARTEAGNR